MFRDGLLLLGFGFVLSFLHGVPQFDPLAHQLIGIVVSLSLLGGFGLCVWAVGRKLAQVIDGPAAPRR